MQRLALIIGLFLPSIVLAHSTASQGVVGFIQHVAHHFAMPALIVVVAAIIAVRIRARK